MSCVVTAVTHSKIARHCRIIAPFSGRESRRGHREGMPRIVANRLGRAGRATNLQNTSRKPVAARHLGEGFLARRSCFDRLLRTSSTRKQALPIAMLAFLIAVRFSRAQHPFQTPSLSASVDDVDGAIGDDAPRLPPRHRAFVPEL
jgi:hypothetical protein